MGLITAVLVGFLSIIVPGFFIALGLLKKTKFNMFEIVVIGFILGMVLPPMAVWLESYLIPYSSAFSFSAGLYNLNVLAITIIGIVLSFKQGAFDSLPALLGTKAGRYPGIKAVNADYKKRLAEVRDTISRLGMDLQVIKEHQKEEDSLARRHEDEIALLQDAGPEERAKVAELHRNQEKTLYEEHEQEEKLLISRASGAAAPQRKPGIKLVWVLLALLMVFTFATRFVNVGISPKYFEFDPYFDMVSTQYILTFGYQLYLDHSAWPAVPAGTNHRAEPLIPYIEAYWYDVAGPQPQATLGGTVPIAGSVKYTPPNTNLLSLVSSYYPPIAAALLVFVVFLFLYHIYGEYPAMIGAVLVAAMPTLITTFIAGEQLLEPFGIMLLFFFFGTYLIAAENPKNPRYAVLAGLAFAANFLGAQYYTVPTGILAVYIVAQGLFNVIKGSQMRDFYKMNAIVIAVFAVLFILYMPYAATLQNRIPAYFGIPIIISFPLIALLLVAIFQAVPVLLKRYGVLVRQPDWRVYLGWLAVLLLALIVAVALTPLGGPVKAYLSLSSHFTHPSTPLFMTVQQYAPTGLDFNFGAAGFGPIGANLFAGSGSNGYSFIIWPVLIVFAALEFYAIFVKNSQTGIMVLAIVVPLAYAGMSEVKYLPHFGVAYILAICVVIGEVMVWLKIKPGETERPAMFFYAFIIALLFLSVIASALVPQNSGTANLAAAIIALVLFAAGMIFYVIAGAWSAIRGSPKVPVTGIITAILLMAILSVSGTPFGSALLASLAMGIVVLLVMSLSSLSVSRNYKYFMCLYLFMALVVLIELVPSFTSVFSASMNQNCNSIIRSNNAVGEDMFCSTVPQYWLQATAWMRENIGPYGPRILAWWDYGDWINWFGNSNAVIRGDNSVPTEDYATAARYVLGQSDGYGPSNLASYMSSIQSKYVLFDDQLVPKWGALDFLACIYTNQTSQAYAYSAGKQYGQPFLLGTSPCEVSHSPAELLVPVNVTSPGAYCSFSNATSAYLNSVVIIGSSVPQAVNQTYCLPTSFLNNYPNSSPTRLLTSNGLKTNAIVTAQLFQGLLNAGPGQQFAEFMILYLPNGPNGTVTDAPSRFYSSNYYRGFFLGKLPGFTLAYPSNFTGVNYVNASSGIMIFSVDNYTGGNAPTTPKPSYANNSYTMPG